ncbi:uncharacterized protein LOC135701870 [Ochlerotatus camptorhynchus]|uniref:uncharacterized protein LOC135701870 n=1 Tax=Ochlerotatus camptorhynchus TaxID=644619 RepID=UPI0031E37DD0
MTKTKKPRQYWRKEKNKNALSNVAKKNPSMAASMQKFLASKPKTSSTIEPNSPDTNPMNDSGEDSSSDDLLVENNPDTGNKMQEKDSSTDKTPAITGDQKKQSCFSGNARPAACPVDSTYSEHTITDSGDSAASVSGTARRSILSTSKLSRKRKFTENMPNEATDASKREKGSEIVEKQDHNAALQKDTKTNIPALSTDSNEEPEIVENQDENADLVLDTQTDIPTQPTNASTGENLSSNEEPEIVKNQDQDADLLIGKEINIPAASTG